MTPEELNRTIEFIVQSQARLAAGQEQDREDRLAFEKWSKNVISELALNHQRIIELLQNSSGRLERSEELIQSSQQRLEGLEELLQSSQQRLERSEQRLERSEDRLERSEQRLERAEREDQAAQKRHEELLREMRVGFDRILEKLSKPN
jgi:hypothetical protein